MPLSPPDRDTFLPPVNPGEGLRDLGRMLRRRWALVAACLLGAVAAALLYLAQATPVFTANGSLLIDPRYGQTPGGGAQVIPGLLSSDALTVDSEIRVLTSREVTLAAVRELGLGEFPAPEGRTLARLPHFLGPGRAEAAPRLTAQMRAEQRMEAVRRAFVQGLEVQRAGESYVLDISFTTPRLDLAPRAVNTLIREYLRVSGQNQAQMQERSRQWLSARIEELGRGLRAAEQRVAAYRREHQLLASDGQLLPSEMALNAANRQLVQLRGEAQAKAVQADQLAEKIALGRIDAVRIPAADRTRALEEFEARYAKLLQDEREVLVIWDKTVPSAVDLRRRQAETRDLILAEYRQILDGLRMQQEALDLRAAATQELIAEAEATYGADIAKSVELRSLEREAGAKRDLYERLLEEFNSASQLATFDTVAARVIAWAVAPVEPSAPRSRLIVLGAALAGLVLGCSVVFLAESLDQTFRTPREVTEELGLDFLGVIPAFRSESGGRARGAPLLPPAARRLDFALRAPHSVTAETLRALHGRLARTGLPQAGEGGRVIGLTSTLRAEGKTTTAFNLAVVFAREGERVAILDLDPVGRDLTRQLGAVLPRGNALATLCRNPEAAAATLPLEGAPGLTVIGNSGPHFVERFAPRDMENLRRVLAALRAEHDYVIVDLPPVLGAVEAQLLAPLCDGVIHLVRWGRTPREQVAAALRQLDLPQDSMLGALYTRAGLRDYGRYNLYGSLNYYSNYRES
ncbi:hypothetical protein E0K89_013205 [Aquicoccus sp. SCR17]|nr:hypothetical protein [Carideicomes alvinocaridis]